MEILGVLSNIAAKPNKDAEDGDLETVDLKVTFAATVPSATVGELAEFLRRGVVVTVKNARA